MTELVLGSAANAPAAPRPVRRMPPTASMLTRRSKYEDMADECMNTPRRYARVHEGCRDQRKGDARESPVGSYPGAGFFTIGDSVTLTLIHPFVRTAAKWVM